MTSLENESKGKQELITQLDRRQELTIQPHEDGLVLLPWLASRYTYFSLEKWKQYICDGRITVNHFKTIPGTLLFSGDIISYYAEPVIEPRINRDYKVIYEDKDLLVIDKPSDLPCHPGGIYFKNTLWYILKQRYEYLSLVNRLDRETSGIMLIAKNKASASFYFNKMRDREIEKEYLVLVHGIVTDDIDGRGWLVKDADSIIRKKRKFIPDVNALPEESLKDREFSHSSFRTIQSDAKYSLLHCKIYTGRTHQIRATICSLGYPVVGDKIYGLDDSLFLKFISDTLTMGEWDDLVLQNQALHSFKTRTPMINGKTAVFTSPPSEDWPIGFEE